MKTEGEDLVVMGRVVAPYGVKGWLKVVPDTELLDGLLDYKSWWLGKAPDWRELKVTSAKIHNDVLVVKLVGIDDRDAAFASKGKQVAVARTSLPKPASGEYYWSDLIGLAVKNKQDVDFGQVIEVFATGANDVLVVKGEAKRLIPFIAQAVLEVDLEAQAILVDWDENF